jgi:integrase/recombinase XerD
MFLFFLDTGIRRSELLRLNIGDVLPDGTVILSSSTTKNRIPRKAYLVAETRRALLKYLSARMKQGEQKERPPLTLEDPLFATERGGRFSPTGVYEVLRRCVKKADISKAGLHAFRRTFVTETRMSGASEIETSKLAGHGKGQGDLNQTKTYLDYGDDYLRAVHERNSPVKKLNSKRKPQKLKLRLKGGR